MKLGERTGKEYSISDLIGRPQYTAFKANSSPLISFRFMTIHRSPGADDYLIDADRSTLRPFGPELKADGLSTGYPIETYL